MGCLWMLAGVLSESTLESGGLTVTTYCKFLALGVLDSLGNPLRRVSQGL